MRSAYPVSPSAETRGPSAKAKSRRFGLRLTLAGWIGLPMFAVLLLSAFNSEINLLYLAAGISVAALVLNMVLVRTATLGLSAERSLPDVGRVAEPLEVHVKLHNRNWLYGAYALSVEDRLTTAEDAPVEVRAGAAVGFVPHLPARQSGTTVYRLVPAVRGQLEFQEILVRTRFPFGLLQGKLSIEARQSLLIWPERGYWRGGAALLAGGCAQSERPLRSRGHIGSEEFIGLREYRDGDSPRLIHWRSSARRGKLMLRQMATPKFGRLWVLLDTLADAADAEAVARRELAICFAATVVEDALSAGWSVGLSAWDGHHWASHLPSSELAQHHRILDLLSGLANNAEHRLTELLGQFPPEQAVNSTVLTVWLGLTDTGRVPSPAATWPGTAAAGSLQALAPRPQPSEALLRSAIDWRLHEVGTEAFAAEFVLGPP